MCTLPEKLCFQAKLKQTHKKHVSRYHVSQKAIFFLLLNLHLIVNIICNSFISRHKIPVAEKSVPTRQTKPVAKTAIPRRYNFEVRGEDTVENIVTALCSTNLCCLLCRYTICRDEFALAYHQTVCKGEKDRKEKWDM